MEASERQQLPLDSGHEGSVRVLGDRLVIESLTVSDERAARVVRERAEAGYDPVETVADAVEVGTRVLGREGLEADVDLARAEFERAASALNERWGEQARGVVESLQQEMQRAFEPESGMVSQAITSQVDELAEQIAKNFDGERATAVQHQIRELTSKAVEERMQALVRHLSSEDGANPLADFKQAMGRIITEAARNQEAHSRRLGEKLGEVEKAVVRLDQQAEARRQVAEVEERGTAKGRSFEELVHGALEEIAQGRGDAASHVGDERGESGGKKGDSIVEVGAAEGPAQARLVFEVKNTRLSKNDAWRELNAALEQRDAAFAVLVVGGEDKVPAGRQQLHEYEGNKMIVAVDREQPVGIALEFAYRYARSRALMARSRSLAVDAQGVRDAAERARSELRELQKARLALTGITDGAERVRATIDAIDESVRTELDGIDALVAASDSVG
jgi:hypothetical protein